MIYLSGLDSIIESIYLSDLISTQIGKAQIFVNPNQAVPENSIKQRACIISDHVRSVDVCISHMFK